MTTARDIMTDDAICVGAYDSLSDAAQKMRDLGVRTLPICGADNRLKGMITERDIVVKCIAEGGDPANTHVLRFADGAPVIVEANDSLEDVLGKMTSHNLSRLPVIHDHRLVGMVSATDVAQHLPAEQVVALVGSFFSATAGR
jgi:CBS domain-containing protein